MRQHSAGVEQSVAQNFSQNYMQENENIHKAYYDPASLKNTDEWISLN